jgi:ribosomal protein S18 acetylase RimI-like enzyme
VPGREPLRQTVAAGDPLANPAWYSLAGRHARFASGSGRARRYDPEVSVFAAVERDDERSWGDLAALAGAHGAVVLIGPVPFVVPPGWSVREFGVGLQMVLDSAPRVDPRPSVDPSQFAALGPDDADDATALVALTQPGPFRPRTLELGTYVGYREGGRLLAMAGERLCPPGHTEVSAVCTHPDARGRGLAGALTTHVANRIRARGEVPFLHVKDDNHSAIAVYRRLGFATRRELTFNLVTAPG